MKNYLLAILFSVGAIAASAQNTTVKAKTPASASAKKKATQKGKTPRKNKQNRPVRLTDTSSQQAFGPGYPYRSKLMMQKSGQATTGPMQSGTNSYPQPNLNLPKHQYGLANGKLYLGTTTATSSGTVYGSGGVGTGTSINGIGTAASVPGVNGKAADAGVGLWGTKPTVINSPAVKDSIR